MNKIVHELAKLSRFCSTFSLWRDFIMDHIRIKMSEPTLLNASIYIRMYSIIESLQRLILFRTEGVLVISNE